MIEIAATWYMVANVLWGCVILVATVYWWVVLR